jgi:hypothetical protein
MVDSSMIILALVLFIGFMLVCGVMCIALYIAARGAFLTVKRLIVGGSEKSHQARDLHSPQSFREYPASQGFPSDRRIRSDTSARETASGQDNPLIWEV